MISAVHEDENRRGSARYTLTGTEDGHVRGVCAEVDGLFGEPPREMYELFGWVPPEPSVPARVGNRVWLVPDDKALDAWLLEDAESSGQSRRQSAAHWPGRLRWPARGAQGTRSSPRRPPLVGLLPGIHPSPAARAGTAPARPARFRAE
ncbi:hypothetical protein GCM10010245_89470 [Streptomyces spectabilis]|nr:hypothetical protein GCM10010245_89470 [Streptomyces spectabilis]